MGFSLPNKHKNLDPSYKTDQYFCVYFHSVKLKFHSGDLGFWDCSKRENRHLTYNREIRYLSFNIFLISQSFFKVILYFIFSITTLYI